MTFVNGVGGAAVRGWRAVSTLQLQLNPPSYDHIAQLLLRRQSPRSAGDSSSRPPQDTGEAAVEAAGELCAGRARDAQRASWRRDKRFLLRCTVVDYHHTFFKINAFIIKWISMICIRMRFDSYMTKCMRLM